MPEVTLLALQHAGILNLHKHFLCIPMTKRMGQKLLNSSYLSLEPYTHFSPMAGKKQCSQGGHQTTKGTGISVMLQCQPSYCHHWAPMACMSPAWQHYKEVCGPYSTPACHPRTPPKHRLFPSIQQPANGMPPSLCHCSGRLHQPLPQGLLASLSGQWGYYNWI